MNTPSHENRRTTPIAALYMALLCVITLAIAALSGCGGTSLGGQDTEAKQLIGSVLEGYLQVPNDWEITNRNGNTVAYDPEHIVSMGQDGKSAGRSVECYGVFNGSAEETARGIAEDVGVAQQDVTQTDVKGKTAWAFTTKGGYTTCYFFQADEKTTVSFIVTHPDENWDGKFIINTFTYDTDGPITFDGMQWAGCEEFGYLRVPANWRCGWTESENKTVTTIAYGPLPENGISDVDFSDKRPWRKAVLSIMAAKGSYAEAADAFAKEHKDAQREETQANGANAVLLTEDDGTLQTAHYFIDHGDGTCAQFSFTGKSGENPAALFLNTYTPSKSGTMAQLTNTEKTINSAGLKLVLQEGDTTISDDIVWGAFSDGGLDHDNAEVAGIMVDSELNAIYVCCGIDNLYQGAMSEEAITQQLYDTTVSDLEFIQEYATSEPKMDTCTFLGKEHPCVVMGIESQGQEFMTVALGIPAADGKICYIQTIGSTRDEAMEMFSRAEPL